MRVLLLLSATLAVPLAADAQPRPPAHFPGSKGAKADVYAAQYAEYQNKLNAYNAPQPSPQPLPRPVVADGRDVPKVSRLDPKPPTAAELAGSIEKLEAETTKALDQLAEQIKGLSEDKKTFADLDKTLETAKRVNAALLARCEAISGAGKDLTAALGKLKRALGEAPKVYRQMAADRRSKAREAVFARERDSWTDQAEMCDAAVVLCEKRFAQLFSAPTSESQSFASGVDDVLAEMRRMIAVHAGWKEVLDAFPTTAQGQKVDAALAKLSNYVEDLDSYGDKMRALTEAMKAKADELPAVPKK